MPLLDPSLDPPPPPTAESLVDVSSAGVSDYGTGIGRPGEPRLLADTPTSALPHLRRAALAMSTRSARVARPRRRVSGRSAAVGPLLYACTRGSTASRRSTLEWRGSCSPGADPNAGFLWAGPRLHRADRALARARRHQSAAAPQARRAPCCSSRRRSQRRPDALQPPLRARRHLSLLLPRAGATGGPWIARLGVAAQPGAARRGAVVRGEERLSRRVASRAHGVDVNARRRTAARPEGLRAATCHRAHLGTGAAVARRGPALALGPRGGPLASASALARCRPRRLRAAPPSALSSPTRSRSLAPRALPPVPPPPP